MFLRDFKHGVAVHLGGVLFALLAAAPLPSLGQRAPRPDLPADPQELVRRVIANEVNTVPQQRFMYRVTKLKQDGSEVREMVETDDIVIGRLLMLNGKPLSRDHAAREDRRLQRLVDDPDSLREKRKEQQEEDQRVRHMVRALPDAFIYEYAGLRPGLYGELVMLNFKPNPHFNPPSRETQVYRGMQGMMEINLPAMRLARIEATLVSDVNFGWGILGHLDRGGRFVVEQAPAAAGQWVTTHMVLNFTGKVLIFKSIKIRLDQSTSDYQQVPRMSVAQAVDLLKKMDGELARSSGGPAR